MRISVVDTGLSSLGSWWGTSRCSELGPGDLSEPDRQGPIAITAADRELGYRPRWGLARGIDDYCTWRESSDLAEGAA
jgi:nucleoside-diphosphate-sugar epimerase